MTTIERQWAAHDAHRREAYYLEVYYRMGSQR